VERSLTGTGTQRSISDGDVEGLRRDHLRSRYRLVLELELVRGRLEATLLSLQLIAKANTSILNFLVWQKPRERLVVKVNHIDPIAERVAEGAPKSGNEL
jgi:hypothetical protein